MPNVFFADAQDLRVAAYSGANCVLIAMSLADNATENLAGFAIFRQADGEPEQVLLNRLNFDELGDKRNDSKAAKMDAIQYRSDSKIPLGRHPAKWYRKDDDLSCMRNVFHGSRGNLARRLPGSRRRRSQARSS